MSLDKKGEKEQRRTGIEEPVNASTGTHPRLLLSKRGEIPFPEVIPARERKERRVSGIYGDKILKY